MASCCGMGTGRCSTSSRRPLPSVWMRRSSGTMRALSAAKKASSCAMLPPFSNSSRQASYQLGNFLSHRSIVWRVKSIIAAKESRNREKSSACLALSQSP